MINYNSICIISYFTDNSDRYFITDIHRSKKYLYRLIFNR